MPTSHHGRPTAIRDRSWPIEQLPGLPDDASQQLQQLGIHTTQELLERTRTAVQRQAIATHLHLHTQYVNKWIALANLACIPIVGCQYCGLLLHAGIASPEQLAQTPVQKVYQQLLKLQVALLQRQDLCPALEEVSVWIQQARSLVRYRMTQAKP